MERAYRDLKRKTFASIGWTLVRICTDQGFSFAIFVVLARLLSPHEMGVFALAIVVTELGRLIAGAGFADALIREPVLDEELADSIFWVNLAFACALFLVLLALAWPMAWYFGEPSLSGLVCALSLVPPVAALGSIHTARTMRAFGHKSVAARSLVSNALGGGAAIGAALAGWGASSLVLQRGVVECVIVLLAWHAYPWIPARRIAFARVRQIWTFSWNIMLTQVLLMVMTRSQDVIIGKTLSVAAVGIYRLGWRAIDLLIQVSVAPFAAIALPTLSRLQDNREGFNAAVIRFNGAIALFACPAMLGFGALAPQLVPLLFGAPWKSAGMVAQVLSLLALPHATSSLTGPVFAARGASRVTVHLAWIQLGLTLAAVLVAAPYGPLAVAIAYVARAYLMWPLQIHLLLKETGLPFVALLRAVYLPVVAAAVAAGTVVALAPWLSERIAGWAYVGVAALGEALAMAALLWIIGRGHLREQVAALRSLRQP